MKKEDFRTGIIFILIGVFLILGKLDVFRFSLWRVLRDLWPIIFIALGLSLVFQKYKWANMVIFILFAATIVLYGVSCIRI